MSKPLLLVLAWATCLYLVMFLFPQKTNFDYSYESDAIVVESPWSVWHLANFDGAHYQNIASFGYIAKFQTAFFPLYPLLTHLLGLLTSNNLLSGLLISLTASLLVAIIFHNFTRSYKPLIALLSFPLGFFLLTNYTESLFLALSLTCWLLFNRKHYLLSGVVGFFCALSRFYGILFFPVLLLEYFMKLKPSERYKPSAYIAALPLLLIPLGLASYMAYLKINFGDPLQFIHSLALWNKSKVTLPPQTVYRYLKIFVSVSPSLFQYWIAMLEFASLILGLIASAILFLQKKFSYSLYLFLGSFTPTLTGTLQSEPRYLLVLFPLFLLYASLPPKIYIPLVAFSFGLQLLLFSFFLTGHFVA